MPAILATAFASWISLTVAGIVLLLMCLGAVRESFIDSVLRQARSVAAQRIFVFLLIPAVSLTINIAIAARDGIPPPRVQDEFSYLLAADTFAHGRVTNPTPAFWEHFETPHELMRPTYMSKYPPGQGLILAVGQTLFDNPIIGIWLTTAAACAAIYWMLRGALPPLWAMVGGLLAAIHPELVHWSQVYWGGSLAVLGGALVLGGWIRLRSHLKTAVTHQSPALRYSEEPDFQASDPAPQSTPELAFGLMKPLLSYRAAIAPTLIMAFGLIILANSRPYEGLVLSAPLMLSLLCQTIRRGSAARDLLLVGVPLLIVLLPAALAMGYYNYRITGHPLRMPFEEYARQYDVYPKFWFLPKRPLPVYRNDAMRMIHTVFEQGDYDALRTPGGFFRISAHRLWTFLATFATPWVLLLPSAAAAICSRWQLAQALALLAGIFLCGLLAENFFLPHYAAPAMACVCMLIMLGWRSLAHWRPGRRALGACLAIAIAVGFITGAAISLATPLDSDSKRVGQTALIDQDPSLHSGRHLIFVRYAPGHLVDDEWVYNQADIEQAKIVWARYMGPAADEPVARHYSNRDIWLLTVGKTDLHLDPYRLPQ